MIMHKISMIMHKISMIMHKISMIIHKISMIIINTKMFNSLKIQYDNCESMNHIVLPMNHIFFLIISKKEKNKEIDISEKFP